MRWLISGLLIGCLVVTTTGLTMAAADVNQSMWEASGYLMKGDYKKAERAFRDLIGQGGDVPDAYVGLSNALEGQGKFAEAKAVLDQAIQKYPNHPSCYYALGRIYEAQNNLEKAREAYKTYVQKSGNRLPADPSVRIKLRQMGVY